MTEKLIPFDLAVALAHPERVRTRDGRAVLGLTNFAPHGAKVNVLVGVISGNTHITGWQSEGSPYLGKPEYGCALMLTEPQPDANGWYRVDEVPIDMNATSVVVGADYKTGWFESTADLRDSRKYGPWTHWRYPKPPVELEPHHD